MREKPVSMSGNARVSWRVPWLGKHPFAASLATCFLSITVSIVLVGFFTTRRRLLHDMLVGTVLINNPKRAAALRARAAR